MIAYRVLIFDGIRDRNRIVHVKKARIGWWVNGDWCPTRAVREHAIGKIASGS